MVKLSFISPNYPTICHYPLLIIIGFSFIFQSISHLYSMISYEYTIIKYKSILSYFVLTYLILFYSVHCNIYIYIYHFLSIYIYITFHLSIHPSSYISHWYSWRAWTLPLRPWPLGPPGLGRHCRAIQLVHLFQAACQGAGQEHRHGRNPPGNI